MALSKRTVDIVRTWVASSTLKESAGSLFVITLGINLVALMNGIRSLMAHLFVHGRVVSICLTWCLIPLPLPPTIDFSIPLQISHTNR